MKVVCCKNCGAKYKLDDKEDVSSFECSSCAGDLELLEEYSGDQDSHVSHIFDSIRTDNSEIVQCEECGLKYKIKSNDNILNYECDSCGGSLRYLDEDKNKELNKYIDGKKRELGKDTETQDSEEENEDENNVRSLKSITNKLENFFSEDAMQQIAEEEKEKEEEEELEENTLIKTARTTIPEPVLSKFGKEFAVPKSNDYNVLKKYLKDEYQKGMNKYYNTPAEETDTGRFGKLMNKLAVEKPEEGIISMGESSDEDLTILDLKNLDLDKGILLIGVVLCILSIIEIILVNNGIGYIALLIGIILLAYGIYRTRDTQETTIRTRIIREHLLTLPEDYYVFYNVKTPTSNVGINHVVVGPTGIYALISQKYNLKKQGEVPSKSISYFNSKENKDEKIEVVEDDNNKRFRYTTKQAKFSKDDGIKQKSLALGEDLINFLNDNDIKNCFVEPLVGFINKNVVVINMPLTDEDLFIDELLNTIQTTTIKLNSETINKCAVLLSKYSADCSAEF